MALKNQLRSHVDIIEHLRSAPEEQALATIRRLRSTNNVAEVLDSLRTNFPSTRPSEFQTGRAVSPPTGSNLEFELTVSYNIVYPALTPLNINSIDLETLIGYPSRQSPSLTPITSMSEVVSSTRLIELAAVDPLLLLPDRSHPSQNLQTSTTSFVPRAPKYCDARLHDLNISFWTRVPISDELAANAISTYLETDHPITGFFDVDLFLTDLVDHRLRYCSSFLVSSFLSLVCVSLKHLKLPNILLATS
jgi:hypothetical protein